MIAIIANNMRDYTAHLAMHGLQANNCFWAHTFESVRRYTIHDVRIDKNAEGNKHQLEILNFANARKERS